MLDSVCVCERLIRSTAGIGYPSIEPPLVVGVVLIPPPPINGAIAPTIFLVIAVGIIAVPVGNRASSGPSSPTSENPGPVIPPAAYPGASTSYIPGIDKGYTLIGAP